MALKYPAETFSEAVDLAIDGANKLRNFVNGDITTDITTEEGVIPSVAKALNEAAAYKTPIAWNNGDVQTDLLQPRDFNNIVYVPRTIPVTLGASPTTGVSGEWRVFVLSAPTTITNTSANTQTSVDHTHSLDLSASASAQGIGYDNTASGLVAADVKSAIDEVAPALGALQSSGVSYDNTVSGLVAADVKAAIDELDSNSEQISTNLAATTGATLVGYDDTTSGSGATTVQQQLDFIENNPKFLGAGQTWQDVTGSRSSGVTYTNTTGKPIMVNISATPTSPSNRSIIVDGIDVAVTDADGSDLGFMSAVVPDGSTYRTNSAGIVLWTELR